MERIKSKSDKRIIVEVLINGKKAYFLIDTGASVGLIDKNQKKKYDLAIGKKFNGSLVGAGGEIDDVRYCNTLINFSGKIISQFLVSDIDSVVKSIKRETGIEILGIIGLSQMKLAGLGIDANSNEIIIE